METPKLSDSRIVEYALNLLKSNINDSVKEELSIDMKNLEKRIDDLKERLYERE